MSTDVDEEYKLLIGGEWVPTKDHYEIIDPNTTELVGRCPEATVQQMNDAAAAAKDALRAWRKVPMAERCALLGKTAEVLGRRVGELVPLVQAETGSTITVAETMQVPVCVERFAFYARPMKVDEPVEPYAIGATALGPAGLQNAMVYRQPVGVVGCITPYNFPLTNVAGKIAPALAMGNTVVIKPAPQDPLALLKFGEIIEEVGFPPGVINIVTGSGAAAGAALVDSHDINMISFTGSSPVGAKIMENGAKTMKRLLMELGGKGALIMTHDCDVQKAVAAIASVWAFHSGQICTAPTRVICHRSIYDRTVDALAGVAKVLKVGDARARDTIVGPLVSQLQRDRVESMITRGVDEGGTLVCGGSRPDLPGYFLTPTLIADCKPDNYAVREEFFGPVVVILPFDDEDEAIRIANDSEYGLFSYVFAGDLARGLEIAKQIESGNVAVNGVQPHMHAPFGGFKMSGIGRDRGIYGLYAYSEMQTVNWPAV
ncbi:MAG TPA: aldehyde dehydrogenase family protein [Acidimicrobiales bacterium]|jgi:acyl-CoA reductase-like NAD-dependent aldehyde dehydrogenase|nr:aldehyde dehydrogenase family protein [Acidimicrobiales bacterium]